MSGWGRRRDTNRPYPKQQASPIHGPRSFKHFKIISYHDTSAFSTPTWVAYVHDQDGDQVGECKYGESRAEARDQLLNECERLNREASGPVPTERKVVKDFQRVHPSKAAWIRPDSLCFDLKLADGEVVRAWISRNGWFKHGSAYFKDRSGDWRIIPNHDFTRLEQV